MKVSVMLIENHEIVREGIKSLLENEPWIMLDGDGHDHKHDGKVNHNGTVTLNKIRKSKPDVIVMDLEMPILSAVESITKLKQEFPGMKVLVLSVPDHDGYLIDLLSAGADGYGLKSMSKEELVFAIKKVSNNGIYIGSEFTLGMLNKYKAALGFIGNTLKSDIRLSEREMDVLRRIAEGKTNAEMARELFTSVRTIETRRKKLLDKTGTTNTATLMRYAVLNGLVK